MTRSRSLATAAGITLVVAGAVSALFLTLGAGASSLVGSDSSSSDPSADSGSTVPTIDDLSDAEVYTLDEDGRLIPFDASRSIGGSSPTVPGPDDRNDDSYHDDDEDSDDYPYHDDDRYDDDRFDDDRFDDDDDDDSYHDDDRYDDDD